MSKKLILLGVNIDHVATIRQARGGRFPDPVQAALIAEQAGADGITAHLREDRRHIQDRDIYLLKDMISSRLNMEMAVTDEMLGIAEDVQPFACCLVPEKRAELTTEGGLDVVDNLERLISACDRLGTAGIEVSLFIDPEISQIDAAVTAKAPVIELHTGTYANAETAEQQLLELRRLQAAAEYAQSCGLQVNAGHGLDRFNVEAICKIPQIVELNIGHFIVSQAVISGMHASVKDMKQIMRAARAYC